MFAEIVLSKASKYLDKSFHYSIPPELIEKISTGSEVLVPFGKRKEIGYVIGLTEHSDIKNIKDIIELSNPSPLFDNSSIKLARWISKYYLCFFTSALKLFLPPGKKAKGIRKKEKGIRSVPTGLVDGPQTNQDQANAIEKINNCIDAAEYKTFLLYGVTGSGKTEVYIRATAHALAQDKGAIILVPEISLTPQVIERFKERFENIALLHSGLTPRRRRDEWERVYSGKARIVIGTRSALFAPVKNLGLIVLDEEYENTYKGEKSPRYNAREVAVSIGKEKNIPIVLGSATPSVESYYRALNGEYQLLQMKQRIDNRPLPPVEILDLKEEKGWLLSHKLREEIKQTLKKGEKVILFLNRRGYFTTAICSECGYSIKCPNCSVSMLYHSAERILRCSHCNYQTKASLVCPKCHMNSIGLLGTGTQRIENEVASTFKDAKIIRMDTDSLSKTGSHEELFEIFARGNANVLVGTQLVTKGLDIAKVTLIGVVNADSSLNLPDFRSAERTFQQLTQVAGRAGRHHLPGKVVIQTYNPGHYAIACAAKHDFEGFYDQEIKFRQNLGYPPFTSLVLLTVMSAEKAKAQQVVQDLKNLLKDNPIKLLGPSPAPLEKIRGQFRYHLLVKGKDTTLMRQSIEKSLEKVVILNGVKIIIDVDPLNML